MPNYITQNGFVYVPTPHTIKYKIEIDAPTTIDVTDDVFECRVTKIITDEIGNTEIELDNNAETYSDMFSGGEEVRVYFDLSAASTLIFKGTLEKQKKIFGKNGNTLKIIARHISAETLDITVTESYTDTDPANILKDIITTYLTGYTSNQVNNVGVSVSVNFSHKPIWDCVKDLCNISGFDCFVDELKDFHFFERGSRLNDIEVVVMDNLIDIDGLGEDTVAVKNKIIVYGEDDKGVPIIYTAEDAPSQATYNVKEKIIQDTDISTIEEAKKVADGELLLAKQTELEGKVKAFSLPGLLQGDKMWISIPPHFIHDTYRIVKFTTDIINDQTECFVQRLKNIPRVFKERSEKELQLETISNPNKLSYSYNMVFNDTSEIDTGISSNIGVSGGKLILSSGSTGTMYSNKHDSGSGNSITSAELRVVSQDTDASTFSISVDNGVSYEPIDINQKITVSGTGSELKVKVVLTKDSDNTAPQIDSLAILYS